MIDPFAPLRVALEAAQIGVDSSLVVAMRVAGMMGLWETDNGELTRMVAEKPYAAQESFWAAVTAAQRGEAPDRVMSAGMEPILVRTTGNVQRLGQQGPRWL